MFLVGRYVKKFFIGFVVFTINYVKCSIVNFQNFINCSVTNKRRNLRSMIKLAIYESISKNYRFLYRKFGFYAEHEV